MGIPVSIFSMRTQEEWEWMCQRTHPVLAKDTTGFVAYRGNRVVAASVFDNWTANSCHVHLAIEDPFVLRHGFLEECCDFVFGYAERGLALAVIPETNEDSIRFSRHVGFREIFRVRNGYQKDVDLVFLELRKHECRWLTPINRKVA